MDLIQIIKILIPILIIMIAAGLVTGSIMKNKGYSNSWYVIGTILLLPGLIFAMLMPKVDKPQIEVPENYVNESIKKEINNTIYKMHMFYLPHLFVVIFVAIFVLATLICPFAFAVHEGWDYVFDEGKNILKLLFIGNAAVIGIGSAILFLIFKSWKKQDHIADVLGCAREYGLLEIITADEYLNYIWTDLKSGMNYQATYLGISDRYIWGIVLSKSGMIFRPVIIPRNRIVKIVCDFRQTVGFIGLRSFHYYTGGFNIELDNGQTIVISYGSKPGLNKAIEAIGKCGIPMGEIR